MKLLLIMLMSLFIGVNGHVNKPIVSHDGNVTTVQIGDKVYKSATSEIGDAWTSK